MAKLNKGQRQLHHTTSSSISILEGFPNVKEGNEGDITLRHIRGKGVYIFAKFRNRWYSRQLLSGQGRSTGVKESNLDNPTPGQQLNFYDPQSGQNLPVDVSEVFTVNFGSPGKLTLGSKKSTSDSGANRHSIALGKDGETNSTGRIYLGSGDSSLGGVIFSTKNSSNTATHGLKLVSSPASTGGTVRNIVSARFSNLIGLSTGQVDICGYGSTSGAIRITSNSSNVPDGQSGMGTIYSGSSDKPYWRAGTGTEYEILTSNTGGGGIVTSGTADPDTTDASDKTPNVGDVYFKYGAITPDGTVPGTTLTGNASPEIFIRNTATTVVHIKRHTSYGDFRASEHTDTGTVPPKATQLIAVNDTNASSNLNTHYLTKTNLTAFAKVVYNSAVSSNPDTGTPQASYTSNMSGFSNDTENFDSDNITSAGSSRFSTITTDKYMQITYSANSAAEGGVTITGTPFDRIYARNNVYYGAIASIPNSTTVKETTVFPNTYNRAYSDVFNQAGRLQISVSEGDRVFFAVPQNTDAIRSILLFDSATSTSGTEQSEAFTEATLSNVENANSYQENYTVYYSPVQASYTGFFEIS